MVKIRKRGWSVDRSKPSPTLDNLENVLCALVTAPSRAEDDWNYLKCGERWSAGS